MDPDGILGLQKLKNETEYVNNIDTLNTYQKLVLEQIFDRVHYPSKENVIDISICLHVEPKIIRKWFRNKRDETKNFKYRKLTVYTMETVAYNLKRTTKIDSSDIINICVFVFNNIKEDE
ncbi:Homeobox protein HD-11 [Dictyocoela muelleri]|nr:Homeobox protein HD-11 [Dictyocoela muelleri]